MFVWVEKEGDFPGKFFTVEEKMVGIAVVMILRLMVTKGRAVEIL